MGMHSMVLLALLSNDTAGYMGPRRDCNKICTLPWSAGVFWHCFYIISVSSQVLSWHVHIVWNSRPVCFNSLILITGCKSRWRRERAFGWRVTRLTVEHSGGHNFKFSTGWDCNTNLWPSVGTAWTRDFSTWRSHRYLVFQ